MPTKILLADDTIAIHKMLEILLAPFDTTLVTAINGEEALDKAKESVPNLIIADVLMPKKNGYELCDNIKKDPQLNTIPVLLLVGKFEAFDSHLSSKVGAQGYITKPFESKALIAKIKEFVELSEAPYKPPQEPKREPEIVPEIEIEKEPEKPPEPPQDELISGGKVLGFNEPVKAESEIDLDAFLKGESMETPSEPPRELFEELPKESQESAKPEKEVAKENIDEMKIEDILRDVIPSLLEKIVRETAQSTIDKIAREVIPQIAERLIAEEIKKLQEK